MDYNELERISKDYLTTFHASGNVSVPDNPGRNKKVMTKKLQRIVRKAADKALGRGKWTIVGGGSLRKSTVQWYAQLSESAVSKEEKIEAMATAFALACQGATVPPSVAIAARKAMNRADTREEYRAQHSAIRASGE